MTGPPRGWHSWTKQRCEAEWGLPLLSAEALRRLPRPGSEGEAVSSMEVHWWERIGVMWAVVCVLEVAAK
jgi:hypothetical protein